MNTIYTIDFMTQEVKRDVMKQILLDLRHNKITNEDAQKISRYFQALFPVFTQEELLKKIQILSKYYDLFKSLYIKYSTLYYNEQKNTILAIVPNLIRENKIEQAIDVIKGGNYHG